MDTTGETSTANKASYEEALGPVGDVKARPAPSEASESIINLEDPDPEDLEPARKRLRYERGGGWEWYRCLQVCGNLSKNCQIPVRDLSHAAVLGNWLRVALKNRPDTRKKFPALSTEMKMRRLKETKDRAEGERVIRELRTAEGLGNEPPADCFVAPVPAEPVSTAPMTPPPVPPPVTAPGAETDEEFAGRARLLMEILGRSEVSDSVKAHVIASLKRG